MPHLRIEYSTNIAGRFDPALLVQVTTDVLVASGVFSPPDAIKVRLIPVEHFRVGSGADHGFIHAGLALLSGRNGDLNFIFPVPDASLLAVEICSETSAAAKISSALDTL